MITINPDKIVRNVNTSGEFIFRGGLALQAELGAQNVRRFGRFLTTPQGAKFLGQQVLLQKQNRNRKKVNFERANIVGDVTGSRIYQNTRDYNPTAPLLAKGLSQEFTSLKPARHADDENIFGSINPFGDKPKANGVGAVTFFSKDKKVDLQVRYGGSGVQQSDLNQFPNRKGELGAEVKDFIKFRIRDAVNGRYIIFPALLEGNISDNSSTTPGEISYIGRPDKVYVYGSYTRSISFSVNIVATNEDDIPIIWQKVNAAKGLVLPQYKQFFSKDSTETKANVKKDFSRPVAPICYLTLGDLFNDAPGFFTSVNLAIPEGSTWTLTDGTQVPHICTLAFEFTYIGKENPTMTSNHYDNISNSFPGVVKPPTVPESKGASNA